MLAFKSLKSMLTHYYLACLFLLITFTAMPVSAQTSDLHMKQGDIFYRQFNNRNALDSYKRALEMQPGDFECLSKVVRAYNDVGEDLSSDESEQYYEQAVQYAEQLQEMFPDKAESYYQLAVSYGNLALLRGSKEKVKLSGSVEKNIRKAIAMKPDYADAYVVLGIYYKEVASLNSFLKAFARLFFGDLPEGTYEDALKAFHKAITLKTTRLVYTYFLIGHTYEYMDEPEKAKQAYQEAARLPDTDHRDHAMKERARNRLQSL
ncbi:MAG: tetratricopeptide repeat protein [Candidatus Electrothrix sp. GW3-4]|uniref:tetratricopeptide repeat protein n=1 Tax=Candidatus Electrothrix sp. GW3-4 TaxID=3126740 RepID=UPI0030CE5F7D